MARRVVFSLICALLSWCGSQVAGADPAASPCAVTQDELVPVPYPDSGAVWIPHEAACGGDFPLVILLHGENGDREKAILVGGYKHMELVVRTLIDEGKMRPILLAEPVQLGAMQDKLYTTKWDPVEHLRLVTEALTARKINISLLGYVGHSAAGCNIKGGLYKVLAALDQLRPRVSLFGQADTCYLGNYHWLVPANTLARRGITMINLHVTHPTGGFERGMDMTRKLACPPGYKKCAAHPREPWCSFRAKRGAGVDHMAAPLLFVRDLLPRVFPVKPVVGACRR